MRGKASFIRWGRGQKNTGTAPGLFLHLHVAYAAVLLGQWPHSCIWLDFIFKKTSYIPLCLADYIIKACFFKCASRNLIFICISQAILLNAAKMLKNTNVIKPTRSWEFFASTHKEKVKLCPSEKGHHFRKLLELLKASTFVSMLKALTNKFHTICAKSARSQRAGWQQVELIPADLLPFTRTSEGLKLQPQGSSHGVQTADTHEARAFPLSIFKIPLNTVKHM